MIIGISGKKNSGKTTVANIIKNICESSELSFMEISFAAPLKKLCSYAFQINEKNFYDPKLKEKIITHSSFCNVKKPVGNDKKLYANELLLKIYKSINLIHENCEKIPSKSIIKNYIDIIEVTPRYLMQTVGELYRQIDKDIWVDIAIEKIKSAKADIIVISDIRHENEYSALKNMARIIKIERKNNVDTHISERLLGVGHHFLIRNDFSKLEEFKKYTRNIINHIIL